MGGDRVRAPGGGIVLSDPPTRLLFVCLGNICRSPLAEAIMADLVADAGLSAGISCESAGTGPWHVGDPPDDRAVAAARRRGITLDHRGRQVRSGADLAPYHLVLAMDRSNLADLEALAPPDWPTDRIRLLRSFDPDAVDAEVPDPYYGDADGFDAVIDVCAAACAGLLAQLRE